MGSKFHPRLAKWFNEGLANGLFKVPSGRHIILNEFPRLMKERRLRASAGVDAKSLREFFLTINPRVQTLHDASPSTLQQQLAAESGKLPALRRIPRSDNQLLKTESWLVYTPPLHVMRQSWHDLNPL